MKITLTPKVQAILEDCLDANPNREFTLFGKTELRGGGEVAVIDIIVPSQESNASNTELTDDDQVELMHALLDKGEDPVRWNCWIHSHHRMQAFWSGTDKQNMLDFDNGGVDWFAHIVLSTNGYRGAITGFKPFRFVDDDVPVGNLDHEETEENAELLQELDELYARIGEIEAELRGDTTPFVQELTNKNRVIKTKQTYGKQNKYTKPINAPETRQGDYLNEEYQDIQSLFDGEEEDFDYWSGDDWGTHGDDIVKTWY